MLQKMSFIDAICFPGNVERKKHKAIIEEFLQAKSTVIFPFIIVLMFPPVANKANASFFLSSIAGLDLPLNGSS